MDAAKRGQIAMEKEDYETALKEYTAAISEMPKAVTYYIERSTAYVRSRPSDPTNALLDAERALVLARERGKRELIGKAQFRRAVAYNSLRQYGDARLSLEWAKKLLPKDNSVKIWEANIDSELKKLNDGDERAVATVKEVPDLSVNEAIKGASKGASVKSNGSVNDKTSSSAEPTTMEAATASSITGSQSSAQTTAPGVVQTPPSKIRHEWYQNPNTITLSLMVKGVPKDKAQVDIQEGSVAISFPLPTGSDYDFSLDPLFARIDPWESSYKILSTKIELSLKKAEPGRKWHNLEGTEPITTDSNPTSTTKDDAIRDAVLQPATQPSAPAYPTSSKSGPKNWDKLADSLTAKKKPKSNTAEKDKGKTKSSGVDAPDSGPPPEADSEADEAEEEEEQYASDDEGDPVNGFFKKLYKNADPDTRRAMMKSYTESNGTALSTNWSEVGKKTTETSPPEGMVAKKWEG